MAPDWCPLFGAIPATWPAEARAIIAEARRIAGAKPRTTPGAFGPERLSQARALAAAAPAWLEYQAAARRRATGLDALAFDLRSARPPAAADPDRAALAVLAIVAARVACETRSEAAMVDAALILREAQAAGLQAAIQGARAGKAKAQAAPPEREPILTAARAILAEGSSRYGLAGRVKRRVKPALTERQINNILRAAGI